MYSLLQDWGLLNVWNDYILERMHMYVSGLIADFGVLLFFRCTTLILDKEAMPKEDGAVSLPLNFER